MSRSLIAAVVIGAVTVVIGVGAASPDAESEPPAQQVSAEPARQDDFGAEVGRDPEPITKYPDGLAQPTNEWAASGPTSWIVVQATKNFYTGAGVFVIGRGQSGQTDQKINVVSVPDVGAVRIVEAPTASQRFGSRRQRESILEFRTSEGATGTLDLRDDSVTLDAS